MRLRAVFIGGGLVCLALLFLLTGIAKPIGNAVRFLTRPLVNGASRAAQGVRAWAGRSAATEADLRALEQVIAQGAVDRARLQALEEENRVLQAQAHFLQTSKRDGIGAHVVSRDLQRGRMHFLLDRGTRDGVEIGQAVITGDGVFVGKVLNASESTSILEVFTDPDARTAASPGTRPHLVGVVEGRGNGAALLTYIPPSEVLKKDDLLVTAGTEEKVPGNLPLGIINRVNGKPTDPFLTAAIEPLVSLDRLTTVAILKPRE
jgi:rod shape-determining protein MreC